MWSVASNGSGLLGAVTELSRQVARCDFGSAWQGAASQPARQSLLSLQAEAANLFSSAVGVVAADHSAKESYDLVLAAQATSLTPGFSLESNDVWGVAAVGAEGSGYGMRSVAGSDLSSGVSSSLKGSATSLPHGTLGLSSGSDGVPVRSWAVAR
ncbi:hypothetical protein BK816_00535 [Boudabousia tangfeifanii]|uniref:Uncharacterized protein n=1 Tax=Boudabousia tangfeifanii TaxID=1912795 RepID=A0A1D9MID0_9ACTO|nr:hypothetical protein [Boudabousia tangfeifanii]AOZ71963.1 hypothetical protein BK816_00535 [Boudabousia tangfeifanii]